MWSIMTERVAVHLRPCESLTSGAGRLSAVMPMLLLAVFLLFSGCSAEKPGNGEEAPERAEPENALAGNGLEYAGGFSIKEFAGFRTLEVRAGVPGNDGLLSYLLLEPGQPVPEGYDDHIVVRTPVERVAVFSTTHIGFIDLLECTDRIIGVARPEFVNTPSVQERIQDGQITEIGMPFSPNLEIILELDPDLIIATALPPARRTEYNAIIDAGIPVVVVSEWLESSPLGRAEWVKLYAALFGKEQLAQEKFRQISDAYHGLRALTRDVADRPSVISSLPRKDAWFVPGGDSYVAALLRDAGASYHWSDLKTTGSIKMDIEPVYQVALDADFWLNPGTVLNLDELLSNDLRFRDFSSVQHGRVYNNNRLLNPAGGNAYWEFGVVQPERILKDLIMILHPDIAEREGFQDDSLTFYHLID